MITEVQFLRAQLIVQDRAAAPELVTASWGVIYDYEMQQMMAIAPRGRPALRLIQGGLSA